jgi:hypothetical protein
MTPSYKNLNAINLIKHYLYKTQALTRRAGEINGKTEFSMAGSSTSYKIITHPTYLEDRQNIFALEHITPTATNAAVRAMYVKCSKRKRFPYSSVMI